MFIKRACDIDIKNTREVNIIKGLGDENSEVQEGRVSMGESRFCH
jgi:hypothetical protein